MARTTDAPSVAAGSPPAGAAGEPKSALAGPPNPVADFGPVAESSPSAKATAEPAQGGNTVAGSPTPTSPGLVTAAAADDAAATAKDTPARDPLPVESVQAAAAPGSARAIEAAAAPATALEPASTPATPAPGKADDATADAANAADAVKPAPAELPFVGPYALDPAADPSSPRFIGPQLVPPFMLLDDEVLPGTRKQLRWSAAQSFAGGDSVAPVNVVHGSRPGPVLCLTAAIHGDEINGVEIVRRVMNDSDPQRLSGTLVAVPIVNLFGFSRNSRYLPDRRDLNRFFPGSKRGSIASRIADSFFINVAQRCDSIVDFHTGSFDRSNLPQVRADLRLPDVLRFSRGFGSLPVLHSNGSRGMLRVAATQLGIPSVTFEVGAPGTLEPKEIETAVAAVRGLMHYLGMTPDEPMEQEPQAIFYDSLWVRANAGGMLMSGVELGQRVQRGEQLGVVVDPIRNVERPIVSPVFGRVIGMARNQVVLPGFAAFHLGEETSAEQASDAAAAGEMEPEMEEDPDPAEAGF